MGQPIVRQLSMMQDLDIGKSTHQAIVPTLVFFVGIPFLVVAHEAGHFLAAKAFGYPAHLSYAAVNFTMPESDFDGIPGTAITLAGPLTNLLLAFLGFIGLLRFSKAFKASGIRWVVMWVLTLLVSGGGRGLLKALSPSGSDEADLAERFGLPANAGLLLMGTPAVLFTIFLFRFHYLRGSLRSLIAGFLAGGLGLVLWLTVVGPLALPKKLPPEQDSAEQPATAGESK